MDRLKIGDRVRRINKVISLARVRVEVGDLGTVSSILDSGTLRVRWDNSSTTTGCSVIYAEKINTEPTKFEEGDTVKYLGLPWEVDNVRNTTIVLSSLEVNNIGYTRCVSLDEIHKMTKIDNTAKELTGSTINNCYAALQNEYAKAADHAIDSMQFSKDLINAFAKSVETYSFTNSPPKELPMSLKITTSYTVTGVETKKLTVEATAELIRVQQQTIKALKDVSPQTNAMEKRIAVLEDELTAFVNHMDSLDTNA